MSRLQDSLVLFDFVTTLLGGDPNQLAAMAREKEAEGGTARRPDGQSLFFTALEWRAARLRLVAGDAETNLGHLRQYDLNILQHEAALARHRPAFRLKYFQYLAALYSEIFLDRFAHAPGELFQALEAHRAARFPDLPPCAPADLRKLAFWMATGSGKTLLLHLNLRQWQHYRPFEPEAILLLTPTETLSAQHLADLRASGFADAAHALEAGPDHRGVQVIEISKLYMDGGGTATPRGGVSLPTSLFEGPNLLLVDEGHKGSATRSDQETERQWRAIRTALGADGFTFEYSATFAQVTEQGDELFPEYARAILFEYGYARFHADGYGKDFHVINLQKEEQLYGDLLLMAGLLTLYEQRRAWDEQRDAIAPYNLEAPLMIFVGARVTAGAATGSEVMQVLRFLDRVLREPAWANGEIERLLSGQSGLSTPGGADAFAAAFPFLRALRLTASALYADLCRRLFRGGGRLTLHQLRRADGEIGLRPADSVQDDYCGVINVGKGNDTALLRRLRDETEIVVGADDHLTDSLFAAIEQPDSPIAFLIGAQRFREGWSSWRVSVMGLLKVGANAGAQVLQLFGRGVRLKGQEMSLRRSEPLAERPTAVPLLETLHIFGLHANYIEQFLKTLDREGLPAPDTRLLPLHIRADLDQLALQTIGMDPAYNFQAAEVVRFDPTTIETVSLDLMARLVVGGAEGAQRAAGTVAPTALSESVLAALPYEELYYMALRHKRAKGWSNLYIGRDDVRDFFHLRARLAAPPELLSPTTPEAWAALQRAAETLLQRGLAQAYYRRQRQQESRHVLAQPLRATHPNFPRVRLRLPEGRTVEQPGYTLRVPAALLAEVEALFGDEAARQTEALAGPLPRLHLDAHLYAPLLLNDQVPRPGQRPVHFAGTAPRVSSTPTGLVESEVAFAMDLRDGWALLMDEAEWATYELFLLRNLPGRGIGFFQTAGFYPDFLLWLKHGARQALAFVDPKGLTRGEWEKINLLADIRSLSDEVGFPLQGFIVTPTDLSDIPIGEAALRLHQLPTYFIERGVFKQEGNYVEQMLTSLRSALDQPK